MSHDRWDSRHYAIRSYPQPPEVWAAQLETDAKCRKSLDGSKVLLKWDGPTPAFLAADTVYDHAGILAILAGPDWTDPDPFPPEDP